MDAPEMPLVPGQQDASGGKPKQVAPNNQAGMFATQVDEGRRRLEEAVKRVQVKYQLSDDWIRHLKTLKLQADSLRALKERPYPTENILKELVIDTLTSKEPDDRGATRIFFMWQLQPLVIEILITGLTTHYSEWTEENKIELAHCLVVDYRIFPLINTALADKIPSFLTDLMIHMLNDKTQGLKQVLLMAQFNPERKAAIIDSLKKHYTDTPLTETDKQDLYQLFLDNPDLLPLIKETFGEQAIQSFMSQFARATLGIH